MWSRSSWWFDWCFLRPRNWPGYWAAYVLLRSELCIVRIVTDDHFLRLWNNSMYKQPIAFRFRRSRALWETTLQPYNFPKSTEILDVSRWSTHFRDSLLLTFDPGTFLTVVTFNPAVCIIAIHILSFKEERWETSHSKFHPRWILERLDLHILPEIPSYIPCPTSRSQSWLAIPSQGLSELSSVLWLLGLTFKTSR